jgi:hypothetical protein
MCKNDIICSSLGLIFNLLWKVTKAVDDLTPGHLTVHDEVGLMSL